MKTILVIFGGRSVEHDISIITGQFAIAALVATGQYMVAPLYISRDGKWYSDASLGILKTFQDGSLERKLASLQPVSLGFDSGLSLNWPKTIGSRSQSIDIVFPALHGTNGEDGSVQGLLRFAGVTIVGCDLEASVVAMNKALTNHILVAAGIPKVPFVAFTAAEYTQGQRSIDQRIKALAMPLFVKPAHLGSSIGITRVTKLDQLASAIEVAFHYDDAIVIEHGISDPIEINCAVLGNESPRASVLERPLQKSDFLNFEDKYVASGSKGGSMTGAKSTVQIPAEIKPMLAEQITLLALKSFKAIGGSGTARFDFLIDPKTDKVYLNEINPLPGSLQQHLWQASGVSNIELVSKLVSLAEERFVAKAKVTTTFSSSVLTQRAGNKSL
jgi:D-alanine-D-alanine ligase